MTAVPPPALPTPSLQAAAQEPAGTGRNQEVWYLFKVFFCFPSKPKSRDPQHSPPPFLQSRAGTDGRKDRRTMEGATSRTERWVLALMKKNCNNPLEIKGAGVLLALAAPSKMDSGQQEPSMVPNLPSVVSDTTGPNPPPAQLRTRCCSILTLDPSWHHQFFCFLFFFSLKEANIQNTKHNIYNRTVNRFQHPSVVCFDVYKKLSQ